MTREQLGHFHQFLDRLFRFCDFKDADGSVTRGGDDLTFVGAEAGAHDLFVMPERGV
jgi:hypothetical protein